MALTALKARHVAVSGSQMRFRFTAKGGRLWSIRTSDRRIAKIIEGLSGVAGSEFAAVCLPSAPS